MPAIRSLIVIAVVLVGCQSRPASDAGPEPERAAQTTNTASRDEAVADAGSALSRDVERLCFSLERSGALDAPEGERAIVVAQWLGSQVESDEGRNLLAEFSRTPALEKAAFLKKVSREHGLLRCPLVTTWTPSEPKTTE